MVTPITKKQDGSHFGNMRGARPRKTKKNVGEDSLSRPFDRKVRGRDHGNWKKKIGL